MFIVFSDIQELSNEVNEFKLNMQETSEMSKNLKMISEQISDSRLHLNEKYDLFLEEVSNQLKQVETINGNLLDNNNKQFKKQTDGLDEEVSRIINKVSDHQLDMKRNADKIMSRLENMQIDALLSAINKMNGKINIVYIVLGVLFIINILNLVLK